MTFKEKLFDPIRKIFVPALPEEIIRQKLLHKMITRLGFLSSLIAVEKDLKQLPHITNKEFCANKRRIDILCFGKNIHAKFTFYPLLMIECKAHKINDNVLEQVIGYNHFVQSYFLAVANEEEIFTLWFDKEKNVYNSLSYLPTYPELLQAVKEKQ